MLIQFSLYYRAWKEQSYVIHGRWLKHKICNDAASIIREWWFALSKLRNFPTTAQPSHERAVQTGRKLKKKVLNCLNCYPVHLPHTLKPKSQNKIQKRPDRFLITACRPNKHSTANSVNEGPAKEPDVAS